MAQVTVLGSANAVPDNGQYNSSLLLCTDQRSVLIDCGSNPVPVLKRINLNLDSISDLILTHFHPDHVSAVPILLMDLWLLGRKKNLPLHGLAYTVDRTEAMMNLFDWQAWPNFYDVQYRRLAEAEMTVLVDYADMRIFSSPVKHIIPTIGVRVEFPAEGKVVAYSCDTEPCDEVVELGRNADLLIHEATGSSFGHTSPAQAGEIATRANAKSLCLIHYPSFVDPKKMIREAQGTFSGRVVVARDGMELEF